MAIKSFKIFNQLTTFALIGQIGLKACKHFNKTYFSEMDENGIRKEFVERFKKETGTEPTEELIQKVLSFRVVGSSPLTKNTKTNLMESTPINNNPDGLPLVDYT